MNHPKRRDAHYSLRLLLLLITVIAVWLVMLPMLGAGIAGLNIAPEVAVMTFARHLVFGAVLGLAMWRKK